MPNEGWEYDEDEVLHGSIASHYFKKGEHFKLTLSEGVPNNIGETEFALILSQEGDATNGVINYFTTAGEENSNTYDVVEQSPTFNGNINAWLASNLRYPPVCAENGIEGRVMVRFVIGKDGSIRNAKVVRGVDAALDKEALRVVNSMPKWIPGKQNGKAVNCYFQMPIVFRLS